jgi:hypothetical protein
MKDSEILRMLRNRIAQRNSESIFTNLQLIGSGSYGGDAIGGRVAVLREWLQDMLEVSHEGWTTSSPGGWLKSKGYHFYQVQRMQKVWTVCWLKRLIDICESEGA